jgi:hypothetical protein
MNIPQGIFSKFYGPRVWFDANQDGGAAGGGSNGDQTNWKAQYETLKAQIDSGQYVSKDSYVTLQRNLEAAVNERKSVTGDLENARAKIALLNDGQETLQKQLTDLQASNTQLQQDNQAKAAKLERHNVIFKEYPHLAGFEADGLIPMPQGDQKLEDVLNAFSTRVASVQGKALEDFKKTSTTTPPPRSGDTPKGPTELLKEANALLGQGKTKEYEAKMDEYHKAKAQASAS